MALDYLAHLHRDSDRFLSLLRRADPSLRVPSCPDWGVDDLLWHLGEVQHFWGTVVRDRLQDDEDYDEPDRPDGRDGLVAFFEESSASLQDALARTDPAEVVFMWSDDKTAGYVRRRMAQEALIHRLDAELTVGDVTGLDPALASDGVDEVLTKFFGGLPDWGTFAPAGGGISVEAVDTGLVVPVEVGRWAGTSPNTGKTYDDPAIEVRPGSATTAVVRGAAGDLDAWLWGRADPSRLDVEGDQASFEILQEVVGLGID
jgi:uncharacterized protein (TIGR03083 family)